MSIDPRLVERRKTVAEDKAKRNVSRLLKFLVAIVSLGGVVWLFFSPWLSVNQVDSTGIASSPAHSILVAHGVSAGTPMFQVDPAETEAALLADPWIAEAYVDRRWPDRVVVEIVERTPLAWSNTVVGWTRRAVDGVALPSEPQPDETMGRIDMPAMMEDEILTSTDMTGALEFLEALPANHHDGTVITRLDGELWASVDGYQVRLGRSVEMRAKALSLDALLLRDIPAGSTLVLIAPTNPSVMTPGARAQVDAGGSEDPGGDAVSVDETGDADTAGGGGSDSEDGEGGEVDD